MNITENDFRCKEKEESTLYEVTLFPDEPIGITIRQNVFGYNNKNELCKLAAYYYNKGYEAGEKKRMEENE